MARKTGFLSAWCFFIVASSSSSVAALDVLFIGNSYTYYNDMPQ